MQNNLIISNGYYTSLVASSIITQLKLTNHNNYLFTYYKNSDADYNNNVEVTEKAFNLKATFNYFDYLNNNKLNTTQFQISINNISFKYIFIPINSTTTKWYKLFKKKFPDAEFIFFEEGVLSYIKPIFDFTLRKIMQNNQCFYNNFNAELTGLIKTNLTIKSKASSVFNIIDNSCFQNSINKLKELIEVDFTSLNLNETKNVLFLPQYYNSNKVSLNLKKLNNYVKTIEQLLSKGYKVLIKDHPKVSSGIFSYLQKRIKNNKNLINLSSIQEYPIELFLNDLNLDLVFSVYSTTLLTASSSLYNIPSFSSYTMLKERIYTWSLYPAISCYLIRQLFPNINDFLNYYQINSVSYFHKFLLNNRDKKISSLSVKDLIMKFLFKSE